MSSDARDLDVVHREHHRARAAGLRERRAKRRELAHAAARAAELARNRRRHELRLLEGLYRLAREARLRVDVGRVGECDVAGNGLHGRKQLAGRVGVSVHRCSLVGQGQVIVTPFSVFLSRRATFRVSPAGALV